MLPLAAGYFGSFFFSTENTGKHVCALRNDQGATCGRKIDKV